MRRLTVLLFILIGSICAFAQDSSYVLIKAGTSIYASIPVVRAYQYPEFKHGRVHFKDGVSSGARLNFSMLLDEIHFIDKSGDTLALVTEQPIHYIAIDNDTFYYNKGFVRKIKENTVIKLAEKQSFRLVDKQKVGGYNMASPASSITSYNIFYNEQGSYKLTVREDILLRKVVQIFISNRQNTFVPATKKNLLNLFPKHEKEITTYLKENDIDFDKKEDLEKLMIFIAKL